MGDGEGRVEAAERPVSKAGPLDLAAMLWVAALDRVPVEERIEWVARMKERVEAINAQRALDTGGPQGPPPTSPSEKSESGGGGAGVDLDRLASQARTRTKGYLPLSKWGPTCAGCGGDEFRHDGYCSMECRDYHNDEDMEDVLALVERVRVLEAALTRIIDNAESWHGVAGQAGSDGHAKACAVIATWGRAALAAAGGGDRHE